MYSSSSASAAAAEVSGVGDDDRVQMLHHCQTRPCMGPERRWKPNVEIAPNCPRCASSNTKFCYYNNYSLSQPRYFCKSCRRYWTKGGSLRNVPVGGGCRKSRRSKAAAAAAGNRGSNLPGSSSIMGPTDGDPSAGSSDGPDIDLAAVFAKFLNDNPEAEGDQNPGFSGGSGSDTFPEIQDDDATGGMDPVWDSGRVFDGLPLAEEQEEVMYQYYDQNETETGMFGIHEDDGFNPVCVQTMVNDQMIMNTGGQDILWHDPLNVASFGWEMPTVGQQPQQQQTHQQHQFQDFGGLPYDEGDQMAKISSTNHDQNWGFFDISGFEVFSGP